MYATRRRRYRVDLERRRDLKVKVQAAGRPAVQGEPVDLSLDGIGVRFASPGAQGVQSPVIAVGEEVGLSLMLPPHQRPLQSNAKVVSRTEGESHRRYGFQFTDRDQFQAQLSPALYGLFNRREAYRVRPDPQNPIEVGLEGLGGDVRFRAQLLDISVKGMAVAVPMEAEAALAGSDRIRVSASLPDVAGTLSWVAVIRDRMLVRDRIHYGVEFELEQAAASPGQRDAVMAFVMKRQQAVPPEPHHGS